MSLGVLVLVVAVAWLSIGLTLSLVMGRRGHDAFSWLILGTLFGPLGAVFAVEARGEEHMRPELVAPRTSGGSGPVDVLVGIDGSPESTSALRAAVELLGPDIRSVHLKDARRPTTPGHWGEEVPLGQGEVDIPRFLATLKAGGYTGPLMIEREVGDQAARFRDIGDGLDFVREHLATS